MWIFTETGFVSAVKKPSDHGKYAIRARDEESLAGLIAVTGADLITTTNSDYKYRVILDQDQFLAWLLEQVGNIEYSNFKNRVAKTRGYKYTEALNDVWFAMLETQK
jgi:hypothetical protein